MYKFYTKQVRGHERIVKILTSTASPFYHVTTRSLKNWVNKISLVFLLLTCSLLQISAATSGQTVTLNKKKASLEEILKAIKLQTDFDFIYSQKQLSAAKKVDISVQNASVKEVLDLSFNNQPLTYMIEGKTIVIKTKAISKSPDKASTNIKIDVKGKVTDESSSPLTGAIISEKGSENSTRTDHNGEFLLSGVNERSVLKISYISYTEIELKAKADMGHIMLKSATGELKNVDIVSTGYQNLEKARTTGSFEQVNVKLFNRKISSGILERLEDVTNGFFQSKGERSPATFSIRGRSTLFADATPLIILNDFPYEGDIARINPNDVESVTILKDAAAASIWGARAGNGVIVIKTRTAKQQEPHISINSNLTVIGKPRLETLPIIASSDYIDLEKQAFGLGYYSSDETLNSLGFLFPPFTPVVELLRAKRDLKIAPELADQQIESLKQHNVRDDLKQHFYQNSYTQRHSANISGSSKHNSYYFSSGYDNASSSLVGQKDSRLTLRAHNTFRLTKDLTFESAINYFQTENTEGNNRGLAMTSNSKGLYPYASLSGSNGNAEVIDWTYSREFLKSASDKGLLNWEFRPLEEIDRRKFSSRVSELTINTNMGYEILPGLNLSAKYQYFNAGSNVKDRYMKESFYTRDMVNNFSQISETGIISRPVPYGDILNTSLLTSNSHQGRIQLSYDKTWDQEKHRLTALAGGEIRSLQTRGNTGTYYGFSENGSVVSTAIDYTKPWQQYYYGIIAVGATIPNQQGISATVDRYFSKYANLSYQLAGKYTITASARTDASNLFGVKANQQQVPLWSGGLAWQISKESFFDRNLFPYLNLRTTYGSQGNISRKASAYTTASYRGYSPITGLLKMQIQTPPNEHLTWETTRQLNLALDFVSKKEILSGSIDLYWKRGKNLLGSGPLDPTTGLAINDAVPFFFGNLANINGSGLELKLESVILRGILNWRANALLNTNKTTVSKYAAQPSQNGNAYLSDFLINPVEGRPVYSIYAFPWAGLDPENGNPRGYLNGEISSDYSAIINQTPLSDMKNYNAEPTTFGSFRNTFALGRFEASVNLSYRLGYYFRNSSVNYSQLLRTWTGHSDYSKRWQKAGDENITRVPSLSYPLSNLRDQFYTYADALMEKADHIRLEDITFSYTHSRLAASRSPFKTITGSLYLTNLGTIWRANKSGVDPNFIYSPELAKSFSLGLTATF